MMNSKDRKIKALIMNDTSITEHYGCVAVMQNIIRKLENFGIEPVLFWPVGEDWRPYKEKLKKLHIDCIIVNGEGSIHHSQRRPRASFLAEIAIFAQKEINIPAYLINATIYENEEYVYENISEFKRIYVRETMSKRILNQNGIFSEVVPDFSLAYTKKYEFSNFREGIIFTDSVSKEISQCLESISQKYACPFINFDKKTSFRDKVRKKFISSKFLKSFHHKSENELFRKNINTSVEPETLIERIRSSRCVVTGRFHAATLCILTKTPILALESKIPKISAFFNDVFQSHERVISLDMLNDMKIEDIFDKFSQFDENENANIYNYIANEIPKIDIMLETIVHDINN